MKKFISALLSITLLISIFPLSAFALDVLPLQTFSFEGDWCTSSWYKYYESYYEEGKFGYDTNTDSAYVTDGSQSLYVIDKDAEHYFAIATPLFSVTDFGEYTMSMDVRALSGSISFYIRCYESDKSTYTQLKYTVYANEEMSSYSFPYDITPDTPYVKLLVLTDTVGENEEGYVDNIKFTKTGDFDEEKYYTKKLVKDKLEAALPGDVIEISDGTYSDWNITIDRDGSESEPITLRAKNPGKVIFTGNSSMVISGDYVNIEGFRFEEVTSAGIIKFDTTSYGSKLKDCAIFNCHPGDAPDSAKQNWVMLRGTKLTVENCFFSGKHSSAQMVESTKSETTKDVPDEHLIKNCYFGNIKQQNVNGYEAIRLGSSAYSFDVARSVVEGCFFESCDGEAEIISMKSCELTIRNNTLYNSNGAIVLRHGNRSDIYGNLFVGGQGKTRLSGVRIIGEDHKVHDNYFYNMPNRSQVLFYSDGCPYENIEDHYYYPVINAQVYNNTFIGGDRLVCLGEYSPREDEPSSNRIMAPEGTFNNNALVSYSGTYPIFNNGDPTPDMNITDEFSYHKITLSGNIAYGKNIGYNPGGITEGYFELTEDGKYFKAPQGKGANLEEVKKAPTSPFDIIPDWVKEVYYDSGLVTFTPVADDVFNDDTAHINNFIPFDVTYSAGEGGSLSLKENGNAVSNKTRFTNNPTLTFTATPGKDKKIFKWYVNGVEVTNANIGNLGVEMDSPYSQTLTINNLCKNYEIETEFQDVYYIPDELTAPVASFGENNSRVVVKNHEGITMTISGTYRVFATKLEAFDYATVAECGFKVIADGTETTVKSLVELSSKGAYGVLFYNFTPGKTYTIYPYAVYSLENGVEKTIYGAEQTVIIDYKMDGDSLCVLN